MLITLLIRNKNDLLFNPKNVQKGGKNHLNDYCLNDKRLIVEIERKFTKQNKIEINKIIIDQIFLPHSHKYNIIYLKH